MPIVPSRQREIHDLLSRLGVPSAAERDLAVARLRLLGARVLLALAEWLPGASDQARSEALRVLEGSPEPRALELVLALCRDGASQVAERAAEAAASFALPSAVPVLRELLGSARPSVRRAAAAGLLQLQSAGVIEALDALLALLLDERQDLPARLVAFEALFGLPEPERRPLLTLLARSASGELCERARRSLGDEAPEARVDVGAPAALDPESVRARLGARPTPAQVARLARQLLEWGAPAAIPLLHEALQTLSGKDARAGEARAAVHQALARLDSRIALYDLRERLAQRPVYGLEQLLEAAERIGDGGVARLLPGLALESREAHNACAAALAAIVRRERLRRGSRTFKELGPAERRALDSLWPAPSR